MPCAIAMLSGRGQGTRGGGVGERGGNLGGLCHLAKNNLARFTTVT